MKRIKNGKVIESSTPELVTLKDGFAVVLEEPDELVKVTMDGSETFAVFEDEENALDEALKRSLQFPGVSYRIVSVVIQRHV